VDFIADQFGGSDASDKSCLTKSLKVLGINSVILIFGHFSTLIINFDVVFLLDILKVRIIHIIMD
jgi:hypothetical protein